MYKLNVVNVQLLKYGIFFDSRSEVFGCSTDESRAYSYQINKYHTKSSAIKWTHATVLQCTLFARQWELRCFNKLLVCIYRRLTSLLILANLVLLWLALKLQGAAR